MSNSRIPIGLPPLSQNHRVAPAEKKAMPPAAALVSKSAKPSIDSNARDPRMNKVGQYPHVTPIGKLFRHVSDAISGGKISAFVKSELIRQAVHPMLKVTTKKWGNPEETYFSTERQTLGGYQVTFRSMAPDQSIEEEFMERGLVAIQKGDEAIEKLLSKLAEDTDSAVLLQVGRDLYIAGNYAIVDKTGKLTFKSGIRKT